MVRNPRVGDRIDQELPSYLHEALPQLSEAALMDAAQPLDDLDEHRRNVEELSRTAATLAGLNEVYGDYARSELRRRADHALELVAAADRARRSTARARSDLRRAEREMEAATAGVVRLAAEERHLATELQGLRDAPEYKEGAQLDDLRGRVKDRAETAERAEAELARRRGAEDEARAELVNASRTAREDHVGLAALLQELADEGIAAGLTATAPDLPPLSSEPLDDHRLESPAALPAETLLGRLTDLRAAATHRRGDVDEVRRELKQVSAAGQRLEMAAARLAAAETDLQAKVNALTTRTAELDGAVTDWRMALADFDENWMTS